VRVPDQGLRHLLCLLELDMGRQRRHLRVRDRLVYDRPVCRQRLVPGVGDPVRRLDSDAAQPEQLRVPREREVGQHLRGLELGIACQHPLLPRDLVQVAVVQYEHDQLLVPPAVSVVGDVDQRVVAEHLHGAIAERGDHGAVRVGELRRQRVRHARAHRREGS